MTTRILLFFAVFGLSSCTSIQPAKKNWDAKAYSDNSNSQLSAAQRALKRVAFRGNEHVLDIGCGDGKISAKIASEVKNGHVVGIDISPTMIEFAQSHFSNQTNLSFEQMDAAKIDLKDRFDMAVSFSAMHWVKDQPRAIQGIFESLKPNGHFLMTIPAGYPEALSNALNEMMRDPRWQKFYDNFSLGQTFYTTEQYERLFKKAGFTTVAIELVPAFDRFENTRAFSNFVRQWLPHLTPIPKAMREDFMEQLMTRYLDYLPTKEDGSVWFNKYSLEAVAKKA